MSDIDLKDLPLAELKRWIEQNVEIRNTPVVKAATTPAAVNGKIEVRNSSGRFLGYIATYTNIT